MAMITEGASKRRCPPGEVPWSGWVWDPVLNKQVYRAGCGRMGPPPLKPPALGQNDTSTATAVWWVLSTASMAASVYHGYKRNESVGWALWWGFMGAMFPIITPTIAVAQGYGERKRG